MSYFDLKKRALMRIINSVKGFIRTVTGTNSVTLDNCVDDDSLINLKLYGNSVQDGTPAPDNPIEIQSVGELTKTDAAVDFEPYGKYKIPVKARGKNLFDVKKWYPDYLNDENGITYTNADMVAIYKIHPLKGEFKENTQYTFSVSYDTISADDSKSVFAIKMVDGEGKSLGMKTVVGTSSGTVSVVNSANTSVDYAYITYYSNTTAMSVKLSNIQIEEGSEATDYEPYHEPHTFNIWADEPLRKVGEYADELDVERGIITRNVFEYICTGTESLSCGTDDKENVYRYYLNKSMLPDKTVATSGFCTHLKNNRSILIDDRQVVFGTTNAQIYFYLYKETYPDVATVKEWLLNQYENGTPIKVVYPARDLVEEIIEVPEIPTFKGTTIYEVETTIPSSAVEAEYYSSVSE